ncbi:MAG: hypothetical protein HY929_06580 [Euryarchaeota archaeon]|nr:hypothetical protein [Euryarchaeota archaeon]
MRSWSYLDDAPFVPLKIRGKKEDIKQTALVDTGAKYVTIRSDLGDVLELKELRREKLSGFGSTEPFEIIVSKALMEVDGFESEVEIAIVDKKIYPKKAPIAIIGRNFLNNFKIILDGKKKRISIE